MIAKSANLCLGGRICKVMMCSVAIYWGTVIARGLLLLLLLVDLVFEHEFFQIRAPTVKLETSKTFESLQVDPTAPNDTNSVEYEAGLYVHLCANTKVCNCNPFDQ